MMSHSMVFKQNSLRKRLKLFTMITISRSKHTEKLCRFTNQVSNKNRNANHRVQIHSVS